MCVEGKDENFFAQALTKRSRKASNISNDFWRKWVVSCEMDKICELAEKYDALVAALAESGKTVDELLDALRK